MCVCVRARVCVLYDYKLDLASCPTDTQKYQSTRTPNAKPRTNWIRQQNWHTSSHRYRHMHIQIHTKNGSCYVYSFIAELEEQKKQFNREVKERRDQILALKKSLRELKVHHSICIK